MLSRGVRARGGGHMLRAQDPAWLATLTSEEGTRGTGMSPARPAGRSLQRGLRALEFVFVGQRRGGHHGGEGNKRARCAVDVLWQTSCSYERHAAARPATPRLL